MKILTSLAFGFDLLLLIPLAGAERIDLQQLILTHAILAKTAFCAYPLDYQPALSRGNPKPVSVVLPLENSTDQHAISLLSTDSQVALNNGYVNRGGYREDRPIERRYMDSATSNAGDSGGNNHDSNHGYNNGFSPDNNQGNSGNYNHNDNHDYRGGAALN